MIKDGVIVDTSLFIDFLKGEDKHADDVTGLLEKNRIVTTGIIIAELLQGIKNPKEEERIAELLTETNVLEISTQLWIKAEKPPSSLRKKGVSLPLTDVAIAALAAEHDLQIFTLDKHFEQIPGVRTYRP